MTTNCAMISIFLHYQIFQSQQIFRTQQCIPWSIGYKITGNANKTVDSPKYRVVSSISTSNNSNSNLRNYIILYVYFYKIVFSFNQKSRSFWRLSWQYEKVEHWKWFRNKRKKLKIGFCIYRQTLSVRQNIKCHIHSQKNLLN